MEWGQKLDWVLRMALLVFILAAAAFLSAITTIRFAIHGREVAMPNVVGKSVAEAQKTLAVAGLRMRIADRAYSNQPLDTIVRQSPPAGMQMKVEAQETWACDECWAAYTAQARVDSAEETS